MTNIKMACIKISQPIGDFYAGAIGASDLFEIAYADIRRLKDRDVELYLGIQRPLSAKRVEEIKKYVSTVDATFPTAVILAVKSKDAKYNSNTKQMSIRRGKDVAKIIDGQHRIAGLEGVSNKRFQVNVVVFIDMDIEDQAMVFATINLAQTKVNKSLVYDLYEFTKLPSPQKSAHNIARFLNQRNKSPLQKRIKILGTADDLYKTTQLITQATFVESLLRLISGDAEKAEEDRQLIKSGTALNDLIRADEEALGFLIFRNRFIDGQDAEIARILWNYFDAVNKKWRVAWNAVTKRGNILPRTNGFRALMRFLPDVYRVLGFPRAIPTTNDFYKTLKIVKIYDKDFTIDNFPPGTSGESKLLRELQRFLP